MHIAPVNSSRLPDVIYQKKKNIPPLWRQLQTSTYCIKLRSNLSLLWAYVWFGLKILGSTLPFGPSFYPTLLLYNPVFLFRTKLFPLGYGSCFSPSMMDRNCHSGFFSMRSSESDLSVNIWLPKNYNFLIDSYKKKFILLILQYKLHTI